MYGVIVGYVFMKRSHSLHRDHGTFRQSNLILHLWMVWSVLSVCLLSLGLNCGWTWSNLLLWCGPFSLKLLPPPSVLIKSQWETGGTTSYTRQTVPCLGGYHNVYTPTGLPHRQGFQPSEGWYEYSLTDDGQYSNVGLCIFSCQYMSEIRSGTESHKDTFALQSK